MLSDTRWKVRNAKLSPGVLKQITASFHSLSGMGSLVRVWFLDRNHKSLLPKRRQELSPTINPNVRRPPSLVPV